MNKFKFLSKGFVLLYSLLVAGIVLAIGLSLSSIISKQITLSSIGKMSRVAYYAADAGRDCAFFWIKNGYRGGIDYANPSATIYCQNNPSISIMADSEGAEGLVAKDLLSLYDPSLATNFPLNNKHFYFQQEFAYNSPTQYACNKVSVFVFPDESAYRFVTVSRGFSSGCAEVVAGRTVGRSVVNISKVSG
ncbi:MAG: hypothetical protein WCW56_02545 [Candidatus Paceibacterota bacterium]|jgi:hypothetical protein